MLAFKKFTAWLEDRSISENVISSIRYVCACFRRNVEKAETDSLLKVFLSRDFRVLKNEEENPKQTRMGEERVPTN